MASRSYRYFLSAEQRNSLDNAEYVKILQTRLKERGARLGRTGENNDGVDGDAGRRTLRALHDMRPSARRALMREAKAALQQQQQQAEAPVPLPPQREVAEAPTPPQPTEAAPTVEATKPPETPQAEKAPPAVEPPKAPEASPAPQAATTAPAAAEVPMPPVRQPALPPMPGDVPPELAPDVALPPVDYTDHPAKPSATPIKEDRAERATQADGAKAGANISASKEDRAERAAKVNAAMPASAATAGTSAAPIKEDRAERATYADAIRVPDGVVKADPNGDYSSGVDAIQRANPNFVTRLQQRMIDGNKELFKGELDLGQAGANGDGVTGVYDEKTDAAMKQLPQEDRQKLIDGAQADADQLVASGAAKAPPKVAMDVPIPSSRPNYRQAMAATPKAKSPKVAEPKVTNDGPKGPAGPKGTALGAQPQGIHKIDPKRTAYFDFKTGKIYLPDGRSFDAGSGKGKDKNNPNATGIGNHGPIPEGVYHVGHKEQATFNMADGSQDHAAALRLSPQGGTDMKGRDKFLIHHPHSANNQSIGCIATGRGPYDDSYIDKLAAAREQGAFDTLVVTRDMGQLKNQLAQEGMTGGRVASTDQGFGTRGFSLFGPQ